MRVGPLQADEGEHPHFAQLYITDSKLETSQRFANMNIPANVSILQKKLLSKPQPQPQYNSRQPQLQLGLIRL